MILFGGVLVVEFNATFNNISVIWWRYLNGVWLIPVNDY
jgi:hypothetical protein